MGDCFAFHGKSILEDIAHPCSSVAQPLVLTFKCQFRIANIVKRCCRVYFLHANVASYTDGNGALLPVAVDTVDITSVDFAQWEEKSRYHKLCLGLYSPAP
ncbi:hypothetical protein JOB18_036871 [Solea senegalensis]|uniref:Uncharacterized protein n=1 Tax=Solea senegalensis TaxID=28829 RepID=A0AAV6PTQ4_SOLSE|nr:hypothetical protein JOB18_036871 [Solea senegalensis]